MFIKASGSCRKYPGTRKRTWTDENGTKRAQCVGPRRGRKKKRKTKRRRS